MILRTRTPYRPRTLAEIHARHHEWAELFRGGHGLREIARLYKVDHKTVSYALDKPRVR